MKTIGPSARFAVPDLPPMHLERERLLTRLGEAWGLGKRLALIQGSPGAGKTTLVACYARGFDGPVCWIALTPADRDPLVFFGRLVRALLPTESRADRLLRTLGLGGIVPAVDLLCDELAELEHPHLLVVLDDVQYLEASNEVRDGLSTLIRFSPGNIQFVVAGREMPPARLSQYRLGGDAIDICDQDLRMTPAEVASLIAMKYREPPDARVVDRLFERTRGWMTGLTYALAGSGALDDELDRPERLYQLLTEEVLNNLSAEFQEQLLSCAHLPRLDPEACRLLLGTSAATFWQDLGEHPLLFTRSSGEVEFHPIIKDFLQREILRRWPSDRLDAHFCTLARQCVSDVEVGIRFLLLASHWAEAENVLQGELPTFLRSGRVATVKGLVASFPAQWAIASPWLRFILGELARREGDLGRSLQLLRDAEKAAHRTNNQRALGWIAASLAATFGTRAEAEPQREQAERAIGILAPGDRWPLAMAHNVLGMLHVEQMAPGLAKEHLDRALGLYRLDDDAAGEVLVLHNLGLAHSKNGDFDRACTFYREAIRRAQSGTRFARPMTYNNLALCLCHLGRNAEAWRALEDGMALAEQTAARGDRVFLLRTLGHLYLERGDLKLAEEAIMTSRQEASELGDRPSQACAQVRLAEVALRRGDVADAERSLQEAVTTWSGPPDHPVVRDAAMLQVEVHIEAGRGADAELLLAELTGQPLHSTHHAFLLESLWLCFANRYRQETEERHREKMRELASRYGYAAPGARVADPAVSATPTGVTPAITSQVIPALEVCALGGFETWVDGEPIPSRNWKSAKARLVLAYLLCHPKGATKVMLTDLLFPEGEPTRTAVPAIVKRLRQALEPSSEGATSRFVLYQDGRYLMNRGIDCKFDVADFRRALGQATQFRAGEDPSLSMLQHAVTLYRGRFLEEFQDVGWCQIESENLRLAASRAFERLFARAAARDEWQLLGDLADANLAVEPLAEVAFRAKVVAFAMEERDQEALRIGQIASKLLSQHSGTVLDELTVAILDAIRLGQMSARLARHGLAESDPT